MSKERGLLPMILGVSALGIALVLGGVYIFANYLVKQAGQAALSLPRPSGMKAHSLESVDTGAMYPSAVRVEDSTDSIAVELPVRGSYQVVTGSYITEDSLEQAIAYYRHYFNGQAAERLEPGGARWVQKTGRDLRVVVLREPKDKDKLNIQLALIFGEE